MNEYVLIEKQELAQIADKVRSLSGSTETMNVLEIDNKLEAEVNSIDNAATAIIAALTEKGIEVPDGTNITGLAELIASIESGGSFDPSPFSQILTGTFTPASSTPKFTIPEDAVGNIGFLLVYNIGTPAAQTVTQSLYANLGLLTTDGGGSGGVPLYNYTINEMGSVRKGSPTISSDGRTFTFARWTEYYQPNCIYGYVIGMVSE